MEFCGNGYVLILGVNVLSLKQMEDYSRFQKVFANVPEKLRDGIVAVIDDKPYTWNAAYVEIKNGTELGRKIYEQLMEMEII